MFCGHCGENLGSGKRFCPKCGTPCGGSFNQPAFVPPIPNPSKWHKKVLTVVALCLMLVFAVIIIQGISSNYHKQILGDWYLTGENTPTFTLYKDGMCLIAQSGGAIEGQDTFFKGTWSLTGTGPSALPGNKLVLSAQGMEPWACGVLSIDKEKMIVGRNSWVEKDDPENMTYWRTPHS